MHFYHKSHCSTTKLIRFEGHCFQLNHGSLAAANGYVQKNLRRTFYRSEPTTPTVARLIFENEKVSKFGSACSNSERVINVLSLRWQNSLSLDSVKSVTKPRKVLSAVRLLSFHNLAE